MSGEQTDEQPSPAPTPAERVTVSLTKGGAQHLADLQAVTGLTRSEVVDRALGVLAFLDTEKRRGNQLALRRANGTTERVHLL